MVHVFAIVFFRRAAPQGSLAWNGPFFLDFADLDQQTGPPPNRGTGLLAVFGVKDGHIVLDPPLLLTDRLNRRGDMHFVAIVPEYRIFPAIFPTNAPYPAAHSILRIAGSDMPGSSSKTMPLITTTCPCPCTAIISTLMFSLSIAEPYPDLRRALLLATVTTAHCQALRHGRP